MKEWVLHLVHFVVYALELIFRKPKKRTNNKICYPGNAKEEGCNVSQDSRASDDMQKENSDEGNIY